MVQYVRLHEPYFDEEIVIDNGFDRGVQYGEMVYVDAISLGISWIQAARMLYQIIGLPEKADRVKFVELVKAL